MKKQLLGFLFDWDGVLCDSLKEAHKGVRYVCKQSGVPELSFNAFLRTFHAPYLPRYRALGVNASREQISRWYHEGAKHEDGRLFPDVVEILDHIVGRHRAVVGIITAQRHEIVHNICSHAGVFHHIAYLVGRTENKTGAIYLFCRDTGLALEDTYFFGDMSSDMRDAKSAGVRRIGITRGNPVSDLLFEAGAEMCIKNLGEIPPVVCCRSQQ